MTTHPRSIGPYQVLETLGDGGTGIVVRAMRSDSGELVAIKLPKQDSVEHHVVLRREIGVLQRMLRVGVRGVVRIVEHAPESAPPWYAMELVDGHSLRYWQTTLWQAPLLSQPSDRPPVYDTVDVATLDEVDARVEPSGEGDPLNGLPGRSAERPLLAAGQLPRVLRMALRIAETLAQLHSEGVVHGDLTPSNILFRDESDPVLIDFGTALLADAADPLREDASSAWVIRGTPGYIAPEVLRGEGLDSRSDLYALGCILYELFTGRGPFAAARVQDVVRRQLSGAVPSLSRLVEGVPPELERLVEGLLAQDPLSRLSQADEVCRVLCENLGEGPKLLLRPVSDHTPLFRSRPHGRATELELVETHSELARSGEGGLVVVGGPAGVGKSRFLREVARRAAAKGAWVASMQAEAEIFAGAEAALPASAFATFSPVIRRISSELRSAGGALEPETLFQLESIERFLPGALRASEEAPVTSGPRLEEARGAALQSLFGLFARIAAGSRLVILIDDAHRIDELSLAFLTRHAKAFASARISIVTSVLEEAGAPKSPLPELAALHLSLGPLSPSDARSALKDLLGTQNPPEGLFEFIQRHAEGNPLFVAEYTRAARIRGLLRRERGDWTFSPTRAGTDLDVPDSIEARFELRIQQLSTAAREALGSACLLGHDFDAATFRSVVANTTDVTDVLEELVAREELQLNTRGSYRFSSEKLRAWLEHRLPEHARAEGHKKAAQQLETAGDGAFPERTALLGYHWAGAGDSLRALDYLEAAGRAATHGHTPERASEMLALAVEHCGKLERSARRDERLAALHEALGDVLLKQAQHREARANLEAVLELVAPADSVWRARVFRKLAASSCTVHEYARAGELTALAEGALADRTTESSEAYTELIQIRLGRFDQLYFSGKLGPQLDTLVDELAPLIESHGSADQACTYYFMATSHAFLRSRYAFDERALALAEKGLGASEALAGQRRGLAEFILGGALLMGRREQCEVALRHFELASQHTLRIGDATLLSRIRTYEAVARVRLGDVEAAALAARAALEAAEAAAISPYIAAAHACQGWVAWKRGDAQNASTLLNGARERWKKSMPHRFPFGNLALFPLLELAESADAFETAEALLGELEEGLPALPQALGDAVRRARATIRSGEPRAALDALHSVLSLAREAALT